MREFLNIQIIHGLKKELQSLEDKIELLEKGQTNTAESQLLIEKKEEIKKRLMSLIGT